MNPLPRAAFFDVDRTLLAVNSAHLHLYDALMRGEMSGADALRHAYWLCLYFWGALDAPRVATQALRRFEGREHEALKQENEAWYTQRLRPHIRPRARRLLEAYRQQEVPCVLISAATEYSLLPLARDLGLSHCIGTRLEVQAGKLTGRPIEPLCYGEGKVKLAELWCRAQGLPLEDCAFYSDSISDLPLLQRVGYPHAVHPDPRLRRIARRKGWPIERWDP